MNDSRGSTAASILTEAAEIVAGSRNTTNGHRERCFHDIANCWNAYLAARKDGGPITAVDVCWMMVDPKRVRSVQGVFVRDHAVDAAGYAA
ncbi:MAG: DUF6378 domain-containing protein, partial [Janthinobacterium lividum]